MKRHTTDPINTFISVIIHAPRNHQSQASWFVAKGLAAPLKFDCQQGPYLLIWQQVCFKIGHPFWMGLHGKPKRSSREQHPRSTESFEASFSDGHRLAAREHSFAFGGKQGHKSRMWDFFCSGPPFGGCFKKRNPPVLGVALFGELPE